MKIEFYKDTTMKESEGPFHQSPYFALIGKDKDIDGYFTSYAYLGQHSSMSPEYIEQCKKVKKSEVRKNDRLLIESLSAIGYRV